MDFLQIFFSYAANDLWKWLLWNLRFCARKTLNGGEIVERDMRAPEGEIYGTVHGRQHGTVQHRAARKYRAAGAGKATAQERTGSESSSRRSTADNPCDSCRPSHERQTPQHPPKLCGEPRPECPRPCLRQDAPVCTSLHALTRPGTAQMRKPLQTKDLRFATGLFSPRGGKSTD
jgi:hypothetical protein